MRFSRASRTVVQSLNGKMSSPENVLTEGGEGVVLWVGVFDVELLCMVGTFTWWENERNGVHFSPAENECAYLLTCRQ